MASEEFKIITQDDLLQILPFGKTKLLQLLQAGVLPVTKVGKDYITTTHQLQKWLEKNEGKEIYY
ncbi:MAG: hypothetical protein K0S47_3303 [Herbinix sp.]|nr:hypothetical protein [Herbinix sp.]